LRYVTSEEGEGVKPHLWLIHFIGLIVPRRLRADWRQEWDAELHYREMMLAGWEHLNWRSKLDLLWRSLGAFADALLLQPRRLEDEMFQDLRFGVRMLLKHKGFTIVAVLTLALGIGANTAVFSLVNKILLAYLPVEEPERLMVISRSNLEQSGMTVFPHLFFRELEAENDIFDGVLCRGGSERVTVGTEEGGEPAIGELVSGSFFEVLGVKPHLGRLLNRGDDITPGAHPVVVLSYRYWQRRFGGDPSVVGSTLRLTGYPMTVIGVSPQGFDGLDPGQVTDLRVPLAMQSELRGGARPPVSTPKPRGAWELNLLARLKRGVSVEQAQQSVTSRLRRYLDEGEPVSEQNRRVRESERVELQGAATGFGKTRQQFQRALQVLMAMTTMVLLIACFNLANLLLAKSSTRRQEFAIRLAVGARPGRLIRQLLTESLLLSLGGAALGAIIAEQGAAMLVKLISGAEGNIRLEAGTDGSVLLFHVGTSVVCGILFGLAPALEARHQSLIPGLKGRTKGAAKMSGRKILVVAQVALSVVVLVGAGLFLRTMYALQTTDLGFRPEHLLAVALSPKNAGRSDAEVLPFFRAVRDRVSQLTGVEGVTFSQVRALSGNSWRTAVTVEGFDASGDAAQPSRNVVGPDYFRTLGIALVAGRDFTEGDNATAAKVAIVNESFARFYFAGQEPLGRKIGIARPEYTIVGVAKDGKYGHVREATQRFWYVPYEQHPNTKYLDLTVRTTKDPESMTGAIQAAVASVDKSVALFNVRSQQAQIEELFVAERLLARLATFFGATAALLAALGLYAVLAFFVTEQRKEIGIRLALGAQPLKILKMILGRGMTITLSGVLIGLLAALAVTRWMASLLFEVRAADPLTFILVAALLVGVAFLACYLPARRAAKVDPMIALRYE
jgi:predicted permease